MRTNDYLKYCRERAGFTQEQLAEKIYVTRQAVSKWERGESMPDIENIIILSDLYDISIDRLLRGAEFLEKPHFMGEFMSRKRFVNSFIGITLISVFFYIINLKLLGLLTFLTFCLLNLLMVKEGGFVLERNRIVVTQFPTFLLQVKAVFNPRLGAINLNYKDIESFAINYIKRTRMSPFDFNEDPIYFVITTKSGESYKQKTDQKSLNKLPIIADFLSKKRIEIIDPDNIIELKYLGIELYTAIHEAR